MRRLTDKSSNTTVLFAEPGLLNQYYEWMRHAKHGDTVVYWVGDLQFDRDINHFPDADPDKALLCRSLSGVADAIIRDAKARDVILTQKKLGISQYEYRATRRKPPVENPEDRPRTKYGTLLPA